MMIKVAVTGTAPTGRKRTTGNVIKLNPDAATTRGVRKTLSEPQEPSPSKLRP